MRQRGKALVLLLLALLLCSACGKAVEESEPAVEETTAAVFTPESSAPTAAPTPAPTPDPTPEPTPAPTPEPTPEPAAEELSADRFSISSEDGRSAGLLLDRNYLSALNYPAGSVLTVSAEQDVAALYVIWDTPPGLWTLQSGEEEQCCGENGFIHELIRIQPARELSIRLDQPARLCDIYLFSKGALPDWVQDWQAPWERADICLFPTHADDEDLFFGGILPTYAGERGLKVQVIYMTSHWHDQPRPHELLDGLWTAGDRAYPVIGPFPDVYAATMYEAMNQYGATSFTEFQVEMLRRFQPSVIVCHAENGEYGHGVHVLNTASMKNAVLQAADASYYPESAETYGVWDTPKMYLHLYGENPLVFDWHVPLEHFGGKTGLEVAQEAYLCHQSQQQYYFTVRESGVDDCRIFGLYRSTVGEDVERDDLMEHIENRY